MIVAGTGHRPEKLGGFSRDIQRRLVDLACAIIEKHEPELVISGMALGWDTALAEAAILCGRQFAAAIPFSGQELKWSEDDQLRYNCLIEHELCKSIKIVCEGGYAPWKMQKRNEWICDNCDVLWALWNKTDGGTANCVRYAQKVKKPILNFWSSWEKYK